MYAERRRLNKTRFAMLLLLTLIAAAVIFIQGRSSWNRDGSTDIMSNPSGQVYQPRRSTATPTLNLALAYPGAHAEESTDTRS